MFSLKKIVKQKHTEYNWKESKNWSQNSLKAIAQISPRSSDRDILKNFPCPVLLW